MLLEKKKWFLGKSAISTGMHFLGKDRQRQKNNIAFN